MTSEALDPGDGVPVPHDDLVSASRPLLPSRDAFYTPPQGFEFTSPGAVLRTRSVRLAFMGLVRQRVVARQLLYRTSDLNGIPRAGVTTVVMPTQRDANMRTPIVSYQCAIDAVTGRCFPSYALQRGARAAGSLAQFEYLLIAAALAEGWAVSVPDHEGSDGAWGAPREPGHHVLDGVRAALNDEGLGLSREAPIGLWGYSGGGLASAWAAELHGTHAPELNLVGAVLGSPVGDLGSTFRRLNGGVFAGLPAMVVAALSRVYPDLDRIIAAHATSRGKELLARLREQTTLHAIVRMARTDMDDLVDRPLDEILGSPEVQGVFDAIKLGTTAPQAPVLVIQAVHDKIVAVDDIDHLVDVYAAGGTHVTYHRDALCEHLLLHTLSAPMSLRWLRERFEGKPLSANCSRTRRPTLFNPSTYRGMLRLLAITLRVITGRRITRRPLSVLDR